MKMDSGDSDICSNSENSENSDCESVKKSVNAGTKKRKSHGRSSDVMKKLRLCTHEIGPDCECKRLKCFQVSSKDNINKIINDFNGLSSNNEQSLYLVGLISVHQVKNRNQEK